MQVPSLSLPRRVHPRLGRALSAYLCGVLAGLACSIPGKNEESQVPKTKSLAPPKVQLTSPENLSAENSVFSNLSITFSEAMDSASLGEEGSLGNPGAAVEFFEIVADEDADSCAGVASGAQWNAELGECRAYLKLETEAIWTGNTLIVAPDSRLDYARRYGFVVNPMLTDTTGDAMRAAETFTFRTSAQPDIGVPQILKVGDLYEVYPRNRASADPALPQHDGIPTTTTFVVRFTKQMDSEATNAAIQLQSCSDATCASLGAAETLDAAWVSNSVQLTVTTPLAASTNYLLTIGAAARDVSGQELGQAVAFRYVVSSSVAGTPDAIDLADSGLNRKTCTLLDGGTPPGGAYPYTLGTAPDDISVERLLCADTVAPITGSGAGVCNDPKEQDRSFHQTTNGVPDEDWYCFQHDGNKRTVKFETVLPNGSAAFTRMEVYSSTSSPSVLNPIDTLLFQDDAGESSGHESSYQLTLPATANPQWYYIRLSERFGGAHFDYKFVYTDFGEGGIPPSLTYAGYNTDASATLVDVDPADKNNYPGPTLPAPTIVPVDGWMHLKFVPQSANGAQMDWDSVLEATLLKDGYGNEIAIEKQIVDDCTGDGEGCVKFRATENLRFQGGTVTPRFYGYVVDSHTANTINLLYGDVPIPVGAFVYVDGGYEGFVTAATHANGRTTQVSVYPNIGVTLVGGAQVTERFSGLYYVRVAGTARDTFDQTYQTGSGLGNLTANGRLVIATERERDHQRPAVTAYTPAGTSNIPRNATLTLTFNEDVFSTHPSCDPVADPNSVECNDFLYDALNPAVDVIRVSGGTSIVDSVKWQSGAVQNVLVITVLIGADDRLPALEEIQIVTDPTRIQDATGNRPTNSFAHNFNTNNISDTDPPELGADIALAPCVSKSNCVVSGQAATITFDEEMIAGTVVDAITLFTSTNIPVPITVTTADNLTFNVAIPSTGSLSYLTTYTLTINPSIATDIVGNPYTSSASHPSFITFTTKTPDPDNDPPQLDTAAITGYTDSGGNTLAWTTGNKTVNIDFSAHDENATYATGVGSVRAWLYTPDHTYATTNTADLTTRPQLSLTPGGSNPLTGNGAATFSASGYRLYKQSLHGKYALGLIELRDKGAAYPDGDATNKFRTYRLQTAASGTYQYCNGTMEACVAGGSWSGSSVSAAYFYLRDTDALPPVISNVRICTDDTCAATVNPSSLSAATSYRIVVNVADGTDTSSFSDAAQTWGTLDLPDGNLTVAAYLLPGDAYRFTPEAEIRIALTSVGGGLYAGQFKPRTVNYPGRWSVRRVTAADAANLADCVSNCGGTPVYNPANTVDIFSQEILTEAAPVYQELADGTPIDYDYDPSGTVATIAVRYANFAAGAGPASQALTGVGGFLDPSAVAPLTPYGAVTAIDFDDAYDLPPGYSFTDSGGNGKLLALRITPTIAPSNCGTATAAGFCQMAAYVAPLVSNAVLAPTGLMAAGIPISLTYSTANTRYEGGWMATNFQSEGHYALARLTASNYLASGASIGEINDWIWDADAASAVPAAARYKLLRGAGTYYSSAGNDLVAYMELANSCRACLIVEYSGAGSAATLTIAADTLTTSVTGAAGDQVNYDLTSAAYDTVGEVCDALRTTAGGVYACLLRGDSGEPSAGLSDVAAIDILAGPQKIGMASAARREILAAWSVSQSTVNLASNPVLTVSLTLNDNFPNPSLVPDKNGLSAVALLAPPSDAADFAANGLLTNWSASAGGFVSSAGMWRALEVQLVDDGGGDLEGTVTLGTEYPAGAYALAAVLLRTTGQTNVYFATNAAGPAAADAVLRLQGPAGANVAQSHLGAVLSGNFNGHAPALVANGAALEVRNDGVSAAPSLATLTFNFANERAVNPITFDSLPLYCVEDGGGAGPDCTPNYAAGSIAIANGFATYYSETINVAAAVINANQTTGPVRQDTVRVAKMPATSPDVTFRVFGAGGATYRFEYDKDASYSGSSFFNCEYAPALALGVGVDGIATQIDCLTATAVMNGMESDELETDVIAP